MHYLNKNRIIYRRLPINDKPSHEFDWGKFYENGTYEYYSLFFSDAKITTVKSLKWHLYVLWYLNPNMDKKYSIDKFMFAENGPNWQNKFSGPGKKYKD